MQPIQVFFNIFLNFFARYLVIFSLFFIFRVIHIAFGLRLHHAVFKLMLDMHKFRKSIFNVPRLTESPIGDISPNAELSF